ncbi:hypothetical protein TWF481_012142 [Arthrobotrys musiformis]|uniref:Uncharacterized protein n=1 Tax=Arthrobotrys musiformis TaxID=47236 RepID=A0AAV9VW77_9PEZI
MKFTTIFAIASAIMMSTVTAAPAPVAAPDALAAPVDAPAAIEAIAPIQDLEERSEIEATTAHIEERANNGGRCTYKKQLVYNEFKVITWGPWAKRRDYGRGLLDNLRGQCGVITDWQFWYRSDGTGVGTFKTIIFNSPKCVRDAIWLASGPTNVARRCILD